MISLEEKKTVKNKEHNALIFLGEGAFEVRELIDVGFTYPQIYAIDDNMDNIKANKGYSYSISLLHITFASFYKRYCYLAPWSYVHLDYCGLPRPYRLKETTNAAKAIAQDGRLRVTFLFQDTTPRWKDHGARIQYKYPQELTEEIQDSIYWLGFKTQPHTRLYTSAGKDPKQMLTLWFDRSG